jgi:hypothetical protein
MMDGYNIDIGEHVFKCESRNLKDMMELVDGGSMSSSLSTGCDHY